MQKRACQSGWFIAAAAMAASMVSSAFAQTTAQTGAGDSGLEEIVVTARQRSERLLDVPVTEEAFTATDIKAAGIERPQDFLSLSSGVAFVKAAEAASTPAATMNPTSLSSSMACCRPIRSRSARSS